MITRINTTITFINEDELFNKDKNKPIEEIQRHHVRDRDLILESKVLIFKKDGQYKVLKSRY